MNDKGYGMEHPPTQDQSLPAVPLSLEGWGILHQMFRVRWPAWKALPAAERQRVLEGATAAFSKMEQGEGQSALFSVVGHKGDLLVLHFRKTFDELNEAELRLAQLPLAEFLEPTTSYVSVV